MVKNAVILLLAAALAALLLVRAPVEKAQPEVVVEALPHPVLQEIAKAAQQPALQAAAVGLCLLDEEGRVLLEHAGRTAFIPASSLKTLTTATALETWGPDHRIETRLTTAAAAVDGRIEGDVVIQGGGDPMLSLADLEAWAAELKKRGIRQISGRIVGDGRLFQGSIYGDFWGWGDIGNGYGSPVCGLNLEHNRYLAALRPGAAVGAPAELLGTHPEVPAVRWKNETLTGAEGSGDGVVIHTGEQSGVIFLRGTVPLGPEPLRVLGAVPNPPLYAAHHLRQALLAAGIQVGGGAVAAGRDEQTAGDSTLFTHRSPPLREIVTSIHAASDNHETDCLFRLLGLHGIKAPHEVIREHWLARGLGFQGLRMEDGCGLARADFITPHDLARLQHLAATGPQGQVYLESLLSRDGLRWKGGAMSGVRSTTGLITTRGGRRLCFALMINHFTDSAAAQALRDAILRQLAEF